jgi:hypothetical protein
MIIDEIMVIQKTVHAETRPNPRNYLYAVPAGTKDGVCRAVRASGSAPAASSASTIAAWPRQHA